MTPLLKSLAWTDDTEPVRSFLRAVPYPTTTISFRLVPEETSETSAEVLVPRSTSWDAKPTDETIKAVVFDGTVKLKVPSGLVCVPVVVPFAMIDTAARGLPSLLSVTLPVTVFCA